MSLCLEKYIYVFFLTKCLSQEKINTTEKPLIYLKAKAKLIVGIFHFMCDFVVYLVFV